MFAVATLICHRASVTSFVHLLAPLPREDECGHRYIPWLFSDEISPLWLMWVSCEECAKTAFNAVARMLSGVT